MLQKINKLFYLTILILLAFFITIILSISYSYAAVSEESQAYNSFLEMQESGYNDDGISGFSYDVEQFAVYDINSDGTNELITLGGGKMDYTKIFTYDHNDGEIRSVHWGTTFNIYSNGLIEFSFSSSSGCWLDTFYTINNDLELTYVYRYAEWLYDDPETYSQGENADDETTKKVDYSVIESNLRTIKADASVVDLKYYDNNKTNRDKYLNEDNEDDEHQEYREYLGYFDSYNYIRIKNDNGKTFLLEIFFLRLTGTDGYVKATYTDWNKAEFNDTSSLLSGEITFKGNKVILDLNEVEDFYFDSPLSIFVNGLHHEFIPHKELSREVKYLDFDGRSVKFDSNYFSNMHPASKSNNDLAMFSAMLSWAVYGDDGKPSMRSVYNALDIPDSDILEKGNRTSSLTYSIARKEIFVDGHNTNLLIIDARGTLTDYEKMGDHFTTADSYFYGEQAYGLVYKFEESMMDLINSFCNNRPEIYKMPLKILITGHSLGGAAANLLGARFTMFADTESWWEPLLDHDDIYVYTFGAIDSIDTKGTISSGYENIHNITNYYDSFGPNGWPAALSAAGCSRYGKYGHIDIFYKDIDNGSMFSTGDHHISTYLDALKNKEVYYEIKSAQKIAGVHCPVNVDIYRNGILSGRVVNNEVDETITTIPIAVEEDEKYIAIKDNADYKLVLTATNNGKMRYSVNNISTGTDDIIFDNIELAPDKSIITSLNVELSPEKVKMCTLNENGYAISSIEENGEEEPISLKNAEVTVRDVTYTGKKQKPEYTITFGGADLDSSLYKVHFSNNKNVGVGKASFVALSSDEENASYTGSLSKTFKINPKPTSILTPKRGEKAITVKWKKQISKMSKKRITGYQIQYSKDKNFEKSIRAIKIKGYKKTTKKITGLKKNTYYYVRIRTYMISSGKTFYSKWSGVKSVKTK